MMDPVTLLLAITAGQILTRLTDAVVDRLTLHGRAEITRAAATLPAGVELDGRDRERAGVVTGWTVRHRHPRGRRG
jgi:hypothetical protein